MPACWLAAQVGYGAWPGCELRSCELARSGGVLVLFFSSLGVGARRSRGGVGLGAVVWEGLHV